MAACGAVDAEVLPEEEEDVKRTSFVFGVAFQSLNSVLIGRNVETFEPELIVCVLMTCKKRIVSCDVKKY